MFAKLDKFGVTAKHKLALIGYFSGIRKLHEIGPVLAKINKLSRNILSSENSDKFSNYVEAMIRKIEMSQKIYESLFLTSELAEIRKLYQPKEILTSKTSYKETIIKKYAKVESLQFYPTKDYLDIAKGEISKDCTAEGTLGIKQLMAPEFFNIRIFRNTEWLGNIYMLDFVDQCGVLVVDRIQIPRRFNCDFKSFIDNLSDIFRELFDGVNYRSVLMPLAISNHDTLQRVFNKYRKKLPARVIDLPKTNAQLFESLRQSNFCVLYSKEEKLTK